MRRGRIEDWEERGGTERRREELLTVQHEHEQECDFLIENDFSYSLMYKKLPKSLQPAEHVCMCVCVCV